MRKALLVLASLAAVAFAGCASSSSNPWATPDSVSPRAETQAAPADAALPAPLFDNADAQAVTISVDESEDLLAEFPAIREANLNKALRALKDASAVEELPMPDKGNARITRYNSDVGVIEFITPNTFAVGDHVVLTKENKAALVTVIAIDGTRIVADLNAGVKGAPILKAADYVLCDVYRTPEELEKIAAEQRKAQREALAAARAAAQAERAALSGDEDFGEEDSDEEDFDEEDSDEDSDDEDFGDDEDDWDDEEW